VSLYAKFSPVGKVLFSDPTWGNHKAMFEAAGLEAST
jgi:aspartate/tyrosine/aromatic aminotransferase